MTVKKTAKYIIGIDEVGRGPLAGPVAVGVACVSQNFDWTLIPGVTDSKKLTAAKREEIYRIAKELRKTGVLQYQVSMVSASVVDRIGIVPAINLAMKRALIRLAVDPHDCDLKLDGGLRAPVQYEQQDTIIKGDSKERAIGLASIVAKVTRDTYMERLANKPKFFPYGFTKHKGYGTQSHRTAIARHGLSTQHRQSYCKNIKLG